jgi:hypothetical protein
MGKVYQPDVFLDFPNAIFISPCRMKFMMQIEIFCMRALEILFFAGMAGSAAVIVLSFMEDIEELTGKD